MTKHRCKIAKGVESFFSNFFSFVVFFFAGGGGGGAYLPLPNWPLFLARLEVYTSKLLNPLNSNFFFLFFFPKDCVF